jgi:XRE family aerobic/anaerobic benzoate catabolism transcriptional regulator
VIALLGLRGAGKSTVGLALASGLGCPFVELDARVETAAGQDLGNLFEMHGESYFRNLELQALREVLAGNQQLVLATSGGIVTYPPSLALLRERCRTIWLKAQPRQHWDRVVAQGDTRPMANIEQAFQHLSTILYEREPLYRQAELVIDTSALSVQEAVERVRAQIT